MEAVKVSAESSQKLLETELQAETKHMSSKEHALFWAVACGIAAGLLGMASHLLIQVQNVRQSPIVSVTQSPVGIFPDPSGEFAMAFIDWYHWYHDEGPGNEQPPELLLAWSRGGRSGMHGSANFGIELARSNRARQGGNHTWVGPRESLMARWYFVPSPFKFTEHGMEWHNHAECSFCTNANASSCEAWVPCKSSSQFQPRPDYLMTNQHLDFRTFHLPFDASPSGSCERVPQKALWPLSVLQYQATQGPDRAPSARLGACAHSAPAAPVYGHLGGGFYVIPYTTHEPNLSAIATLPFDPDASRLHEGSLDVLYPPWVEMTFPFGDWVGTTGNAEPHDLHFIGEYTIQAERFCEDTCHGDETIQLRGTYQVAAFYWNPYGYTGARLRMTWDVVNSISSVPLTYAGALAMIMSYAMTGLGMFNFLFSSQMKVPRHFAFGDVPKRHQRLYEEMYWDAKRRLSLQTAPM